MRAGCLGAQSGRAELPVQSSLYHPAWEGAQAPLTHAHLSLCGLALASFLVLAYPLQHTHMAPKCGNPGASNFVSHTVCILLDGWGESSRKW